MAKEITKEQLIKSVDKVLSSIDKQRIDLRLSLIDANYRDARLKRSPVDSITEKGLWDGKTIVEESYKISEKTSNLSSTERSFIKSVILQALNELSKQSKTSE